MSSVDGSGPETAVDEGDSLSTGDPTPGCSGEARVCHKDAPDSEIDPVGDGDDMDFSEITQG